MDKRLNELSKQKQLIEHRLEELDRLLVSQDEIQEIVADSIQFISSLEFTLLKGLPQEKLVVLRRCIEKIFIDKPARKIKMIIRLLPMGSLQATEELLTRQ